MTVKKISIIMALLVLAIFAVGSVSAADDITTDSDAQTDDIFVDDVSVEEDIDELEELDEENDYDVDENTDDIQAIINNRETTTHFVNFKPLNYTISSSLVLHGNVTLNGNGANITGSNHLFLVDNATNIVITGFNMNVATLKNAIRGENLTNSQILNNNISGGRDGINIMHTYDNLTISGNTISGFTRDGISLVNHDILDNLDNVNNSIISNNMIIGGEIGLFFGGNFKGAILNNGLYSCQYGMQFVGKPIGNISKIFATISRNYISGVESGIYFENETAVSLNIIDTEIRTLDYYNNYTVDYGGNFSNAEAISINFYYNVLSGSIKQSLINMTDVFNNWFDGEIHYNE